MKTEIIKLDTDNIDRDKLKHAAETIKNGGLVAFPTETVYGLGANALDETAVKGIFTAKGRPSDNPLIVHIADGNEMERLCDGIPDTTYRLVEEFWPGPLTLVLDKSPVIPGIITAGLDTVAVRMPAHPVALALIRESGVPIAAPSANTSGKPSPTSAEHVIEDLSGRVDIILDAGNAKVGLESTVLDMTSVPPMILRPGGVTPQQLEAVLGRVAFDPALHGRGTGVNKPKAPGMKYTHYSPKADVIVVEGDLDGVVGKIAEMAQSFRQQGKKVGILATEQSKSRYGGDYPIISAGDRKRPETIAASLFGSLREFDGMQVDVVLAEAVANDGIGMAIMNRLVKAAGYNIVKVG